MSSRMPVPHAAGAAAAPRAAHAGGPARAARTLAYVLCVVFAAATTITWLACALANDAASYGADPSRTSAHFALPTPLVAFAGALLAVACCLAVALARTRDASDVRASARSFTVAETLVVAVSLTCVVWAAQLVFVRLVYFEPGWDAGTMLEYARWRVSGLSEPAFFGEGGNAWVTNYLSVYPNNAPLTLAFVRLYELAQAWGTDGTFLAALAGAFSVGLAGLACCMAVRLLTGRSGAALFALALHTVLFSLSPWVCVPYSDTYASGAVGLALLAGVVLAGPRVRSPLARGGVWLALGLCCLAGSLVKPTVVLVGVACACVCLVRLLAAHEGARRALTCCACAAGGLVLAAALVLGVAKPAAYAALGVDAHPDTALGITHFLMMGQNDETAGSFSQADVDFSRALTNPSERASAELAVAWQRASSRTPAQTLAFYARKLLFSFADGTFNWGYEGGDAFIAHVKPEPGRAAHALRGLYYGPSAQAGSNMSAFQAVAQVLWFGTLALVAVGAVRTAVRVRPHAAERMHLAQALPRLVAPCALLALTCYLLVFECRARYLYCYGSVIIVCAACGADACAAWLALRLRYHGGGFGRRAAAVAPLGRGAAQPYGKEDTWQSARARARRPRVLARGASSSREVRASSGATPASSC